MTAARSTTVAARSRCGCAWAVGRSDGRRPPRDAHAGSAGRIVEFRVDRRTRADLGVWRRPLDGGRAEPGPRPDRRRRPLRTDLAHASSPGARTAGRSSSSRAARSPAGSRLLDMASASSVLVADPIGRLARRARRRRGSSPAAHAAACPARWSRSTADGGPPVTLADAAGHGGARPRRCRSGTSSSTRSTRTAVRFAAIRPDGRDAPIRCRSRPTAGGSSGRRRGRVAAPSSAPAGSRSGRTVACRSPATDRPSSATSRTAGPSASTRCPDDRCAAAAAPIASTARWSASSLAMLVASTAGAHGPDPVARRRRRSARTRPSSSAGAPGPSHRRPSRRRSAPPPTTATTPGRRGPRRSPTTRAVPARSATAPATCGANGIACFTRSAPTGFTMWLREHGRVFDWGTLRWCQMYGRRQRLLRRRDDRARRVRPCRGPRPPPNYADDSDYLDAVVQTVSRTKPRTGYNMHVFGRCDVATLQLAYDMPTLSSKYSTCLDLDTVLSLSSSDTSIRTAGWSRSPSLLDVVERRRLRPPRAATRSARARSDSSGARSARRPGRPSRR